MASRGEGRPISLEHEGIATCAGDRPGRRGGQAAYPLTADRAKPAVPFGGIYRLIDFALSNLVNARYLQICVLTQYKSHWLDRHVSQTWRMSTLLGNYVTPVPAQQRLGQRWYPGSADAIYQSLNLIHDEDPDYIVVFGADHVYRMDPAQMLTVHIESGAGATVAGIRVPRSEATASAASTSDESGRIRELPREAGRPAGHARRSRAVVRVDGQLRLHHEGAHRRHPRRRRRRRLRARHGRRHHPATGGRGRPRVYDFTDNEVPGATERDHGYWRDVGTLDAYYEAHMDLVSVHPVFNLYNKRWPIRGESENLAPAKFVNGGSAQESVVGAGSIISAASVRNSVLSSNVVVDDGAIVEGSVIMPGTRVGRGAVVRHAILDKNVVVGPGEMVGVDLEKDRDRFAISAGGVVAVGKGVWI